MVLKLVYSVKTTLEIIHRLFNFNSLICVTAWDVMQSTKYREHSAL